MGHSVVEPQSANMILTHNFTTIQGEMVVCATEEGVYLLEFSDCPTLEAEFHQLEKLLKARIQKGENRFTLQAEKEITEYFAGTREDFDLVLCAPGTEFQCTVWQGLRDIPYGSTLSYQAFSEKLGKPNAVRALASANGSNRIALIIPCHRIIGKDGSMTGYSGGIARKKWLLDHERKIQQQREADYYCNSARS